MDLIDDRLFIFGSVLTTANKLDTLLEREFSKLGMTTKQWFLSMIIDSLFDSPPTIKEVARAMGSSHQNVKQVALKLQQKGLLALEKDPKDSRITRLRLTEQNKIFWEKAQEKGTQFNQAVFKNLDEAELKFTRNVMQKIWLNLLDIEKEN